MNRADRIVGCMLVAVIGVVTAQPALSEPSSNAPADAPAPSQAPALPQASTPMPTPETDPTTTATPIKTPALSPKPVPKATAQSEAGEPRADISPSQATASPPPATRTRPAARVSPGSQKATDGNDRLDLSTATVTGDREQPKVMYIVPWKRAEMGDLAGKPMNSLVDEILAPVDRDVFKREVVYYKAVQADAAQKSVPAAPQGEK